MDETLHNDELILKYLDGEMEADEISAFESSMRFDELLAQKVESLKLTILAIRQAGTIEKVRSVHEEMMHELGGKKAKVISLRKITRWSMAVAASLLFIFLVVQGYNFSQLSTEKLYNQAYVDYATSTDRGRPDSNSLVARLYQSKNFNLVTKQAKNLDLLPQDSVLVGISFLRTDNFANAISWFNSIIKNQSKFKQDAEFYLSLSYLKNKDYDHALEWMEKIQSNSSHLYHDQFSNNYIQKVKLLKWK